MASSQATSEAAPAAPRDPVRTARRRPSYELIAYLVLALLLAILLWVNVARVDGFYLDEWFYVHGGEYMWRHFPGAVLGFIPEWNRGPQRLYSLLLMGPWSVFGTSTAYTLSHLVNVLLLSSSVAPIALFARRMIAAPRLRILAVALGAVIPWLIIGSHLLTENLAYPLFLWALYAIVAAAETPTVRTQLVALVALGALALCRLNLGLLLLVLLVAVAVAEILRRRDEREVPRGTWLRAAARREAILIVAGVLALIVGTKVLSSGGASLGAYGGLTFSSLTERLFGSGAEATRRTVLTYSRGLLVGTFVLPFVLGSAVVVAGTLGRLGRRLVIPSLVIALGALVVLVGVSIWTAGSALEERYVFYPVALLAVAAVAGLEHLWRLRHWVLAASVGAVWIMYAGFASAGDNAGHFFAAPGGAFWTRVMLARVHQWEDRLFGWAFIPQTGWVLVAAGLVVLVVWLHVSARWPRLRAGVLTAALGLCLVAQAAALQYDFKQELDGTTTAPGGIAGAPGHALDRPTWVDEAVPGGATATIMPGLVTATTPYAGVETLQFWNRSIDEVTALAWNGSPVPAPPGMGVVQTSIDRDGLAAWSTPLGRFVVAQRDDPRIQLGGQAIAAHAPYELLKVPASERRAVWTGQGLDPTAAVLDGQPVTFTLDRAASPATRSVVLRFAGAAGATRPARWRVRGPGAAPVHGRVAASATGQVRLTVPACRTGATCAPVSWRLVASDRPAGQPQPHYKAGGPARPIVLQVATAKLNP